jgi:glycosyltransferase involved in cell wall biosynthesis
MKKRILFVIESLIAAGSERSLVSLLSEVDYSRFDIDLQLFKFGGELERYLPKEVNLLRPLDYTLFAEKTCKEQVFSFRLKLLFARFRYSFLLRFGKNRPMDLARKYWKSINKCIPQEIGFFDVAIAYSQGIPTFYVAEKVNAQKKIAWVNANHILTTKNRVFQSAFYDRFDNIVCASDSAKSVFDNLYPIYYSKTVVIYDRINVSLIRRLADERQKLAVMKKPSILTVARFAAIKGYDITLEACKILRDRNVRFTWYVIGRGPLKNEIEEFVKENNLQEHFIFLGTFPNPYPFFKAATLYVQTSRNEGFGLSIAEARVLGKPVVTTEFDAVWMQMVQGKNGLVVPQDPIAVADAIERLLNDKVLYDSIVSYQKKEQIDNSKEIEKFYALVD